MTPLVPPAVVLLAVHLLGGALGGLAPCTLTLRVRVEPMAENRSVEVTLDSGAFYSDSWHALDGALAPATQRTQTYAALPEGRYIITVTVRRPPQRALQTTRPFTCIGEVP